MKIIVPLLSAMLLLTSLTLAGTRYSSQFKKEDCPEALLIKFNAAIWDNKIVISILNEAGKIYKLDISSSFLFIQSASWQSPLTDTHSDRASTQFVSIPPGKVSVTLYPKNLIKETDAEWHDVNWFSWPCEGGEAIPGKPYLGRAPKECEIQMNLAFVSQDGGTSICKLRSMLLKKRPKNASQDYQ